MVPHQPLAKWLEPNIPSEQFGTRPRLYALLHVCHHLGGNSVLIMQFTSLIGPQLSDSSGKLPWESCKDLVPDFKDYRVSWVWCLLWYLPEKVQANKMALEVRINDLSWVQNLAPRVWSSWDLAIRSSWLLPPYLTKHYSHAVQQQLHQQALPWMMKVPMTKRVHMEHLEMTMIIIHQILMIKITPRVSTSPWSEGTIRDLSKMKLKDNDIYGSRC